VDALYPPPLYGSPGGAGACTPPYPGVHPVRPPTTAELLRAAHSAGGGLALSPSPGAGLPHGLGGEAARQALGHSPQGAPMQASGVAAPPWRCGVTHADCHPRNCQAACPHSALHVHARCRVFADASFSAPLVLGRPGLARLVSAYHAPVDARHT